MSSPIVPPSGGELPLVGLELIAGATGTVVLPGAGAISPRAAPGEVSLAGTSLEQQAEIFRALLTDAQLARDWASWSDSYNPAADDSLAPPRASTPHVMDPVVDSAPPLASSPQPVSGPPAAADPEPTFAELVERHVRRTLATRATSRYDNDEVRLDLTDAVLPDTSLSLRRSADGWQLTAVTSDRGSLERLEQFTPALVKRFASASLGALEVVARLTGQGPADPVPETRGPTPQSTPGR